MEEIAPFRTEERKKVFVQMNRLCGCSTVDAAVSVVLTVQSHESLCRTLTNC